jgi:hypothetical protein
MGAMTPAGSTAPVGRARPAHLARWTRWAALLAVLNGAGGCGRKPGPPGSGSETGAEGSNRLPGAGSAHSSAAPDPTAALVKDAFGGNVPAFPLLANDGSSVAIGIASPFGRSEVSTYYVAFVTGWTATNDAWASGPQAFPIVDTTMAIMLLDRAQGGDDAPAPDPEALKARAAAVTKRLTDGGFSPFDGPRIELGPDETQAGPVKLRITHGPDAALTVHLLDGSGKELASNTSVRQEMGQVADLACVSTPVARRAWFDARRKRVLVEIGWNAGPAMCNAPDPEYGAWPVP